MRKGATGKALTPDITRELGYDYINAFMTYGSPAGMPNWGTSGEMSEDEIDMMTRYVLLEPPEPPEYGMPEMRKSWKLVVPPDQRPTEQMNELPLDELFSVTLRDAGQIALVDGKLCDRADHRHRLCGAYQPHLGLGTLSVRDRARCQVNMIDLWMETPPPSPRSPSARGALGRDLEDEGWEDKYAIAGSYWPPQYVIMDGETLEPLDQVDPRHDRGHQEYHPEPRVAAIVWSHYKRRCSS